MKITFANARVSVIPEADFTPDEAAMAYENIMADVANSDKTPADIIKKIKSAESSTTNIQDDQHLVELWKKVYLDEDEQAFDELIKSFEDMIKSIGNGIFNVLCKTFENCPSREDAIGTASLAFVEVVKEIAPPGCKPKVESKRKPYDIQQARLVSYFVQPVYYRARQLMYKQYGLSEHYTKKILKLNLITALYYVNHSEPISTDYLRSQFTSKDGNFDAIVASRNAYMGIAKPRCLHDLLTLSGDNMCTYDPEGFVIKQSRNQRLYEELSKLDSIGKTVLYWKFEYGLKVSQISDALKLPRNKVKTIISKSLDTLKNGLKDLEMDAAYL